MLICGEQYSLAYALVVCVLREAAAEVSGTGTAYAAMPCPEVEVSRTDVVYAAVGCAVLA